MSSSSMSPEASEAAAAAAEAAAEAFEAYLEARQEVNVEMLIYYAASLSALIGVFILSFWIRFVFVRLGWTRARNPILRPFIATTRVFRKIFIRSLPGFTSVGHAVVVTVYVALNILFSFYDFYQDDYTQITNFAARFGWMATGNMALVVFLALKNTPLAFLTTYSYERLNVLHQIAGYTTMLFTILHASIYTDYFLNNDRVYILQEDVVTAGIVLGFALLFSVLAGMILKRFNYELFYIIHVALFIVIVVTLGLHRPSFNPDQGLYATVIIGAIWFADRLIRFGRLVYNSINNEATVYALPDGGTRIVLKKPILRARPGKHCYVWLPQIRSFETHPFTIVASDPMELVINSYSGFTRDLHEHALQNPGKSLRASVEGPYGTDPDPLDFDKVVLVAGGSGATFTFGIAADMLERMAETSTQQIDFIWAVKGQDNLTWFTEHLNNLRNHYHSPKVSLKVHVTRLPPTHPAGRSGSTARTSSSGSSTDLVPSALEKSVEFSAVSGQVSSAATPYQSDRDDKYSPRRVDIPSSAASMVDLPIIVGRPDTEALIRSAVESVGRDQRVLIAACGPDGLIKVVRNVAASCISVDGPAIEVHCEQFGW
ncbi:ferric reductase NAD binding domain-containing protein [Hypoxylon rubiginosum]|uniref:Ferric reductase NAD binding domain-containing protein n=1 Tax=Hypoxylon rubiginosum TaxID=110542 RepID=A0ACB9YNU6_9PEZI|nr:ferric reductase NAD binding domain-containing protein [Hypoxylon rubiginosum]